ITATCLSALAAAIAAFWPAGPLPITILPQQPQRRFFHSLKKWMANGTWKGWLATAHQDRGIQTDGIRACALKSHWAGPENSARQSEGKVMNARVAVQEQPRFERQSFAIKGGAYIRTAFFGKYPELLKLVADISDDELARLHLT